MNNYIYLIISLLKKNTILKIMQRRIIITKYTKYLIKRVTKTTNDITYY